MLCSLGPVRADVHIVRGRTPIPGGNARASSDLTVVNEKLAFALAVGVARLPTACRAARWSTLRPVDDGHVGRDRVVFADFIPNNWSAWPNTYQHVEVLGEAARSRCAFSAVRDWGQVKITTLYTLRAGSTRSEITATMTNEGARR